MKQNTLLSFLFLFFASLSFGQIVLTDNDLPEKNKVYTVHRVLDTNWRSNIADTVVFGESGANQVYDFTNIKTLGFDTSFIAYRDASDFKFSASHPNANWANSNEIYVEQYRDPIAFTTNDFPQVGDQYDYIAVKPYSQFMGNIGWYLDMQGGANQRIWFDFLNDFRDSAGVSINYVNPANTQWAANFTDADVARVEELETVGNDTVITIMSFFKEQNGDFVHHGIGAKADKGYLLTQTPSNSYAVESANLVPSHRMHTTKSDWNNEYKQQSTWGASFTEGFFTVKHREIKNTVDRQLGYGTMYMPNDDSFEFMQILRYTFNASVDSVFMSGNLMQVELDTFSTFEMLYYAKGYGEPIVKMEVDTTTREVHSFQYLNVPNTAQLSALKSDTVQQIYAFYKREEGSLAMTGMSAIIDMGAMMGNGRSGQKDTINAPYSKPQTIISTDMIYGFGGADTVSYTIKLDMPQQEGMTLELKTTEVRTIGVDGNGILHMNGDSATVLRVNIITKETTEQTLKVFGIPVNTSKFDDFNYELMYWGTETQMPLVRAEFDTSDYAYAYNCQFSDGPFVIVGLNDKPEINSFEVYPNPSNGLVNVNGLSANANVQVLDLSGKVILNQKASLNTQIDISGLNNGLYMLKVIDLESNKSFTKRLIKN
ncbi:MAG: T9SS type A sorting domain-containing protein [Bacteroidia bacterium]